MNLKFMISRRFVILVILTALSSVVFFHWFFRSNAYHYRIATNRLVNDTQSIATFRESLFWLDQGNRDTCCNCLINALKQGKPIQMLPVGLSTHRRLMFDWAMYLPVHVRLDYAMRCYKEAMLLTDWEVLGHLVLDDLLEPRSQAALLDTALNMAAMSGDFDVSRLILTDFKKQAACYSEQGADDYPIMLWKYGELAD